MVLKGNRHPLLLSVLVSFLLFISHGSAAPSPFPEEKLTARAAFLMDASTGQILYQREPDLPLPPASTTKIVTALVALERADLDDLFTVSKYVSRVPSSRLGLRPGQVMKVEDLLYSVLLSSANDASVVVAEGIAGSVERFAELMTRRAKQIGATNTRLTNPHGLTEPEHYSTARDLALIFNYAIKNDQFRKIIETKTSVVNPLSASSHKRVRQIALRNHNRLLWSFDGAIGGKTGYTSAAQRCFVGGAVRDGTTLIVSLLGSRNLWQDTKRLLEYGFENYETLRATSPVRATTLTNGKIFIHQGTASAAFPSAHGEPGILTSDQYILQLASFREPERAEALLRKIREEGQPAYVEAASLNDDDPMYRVRVGPFLQLNEAQQAARLIESKMGSRVMILPATSASEPAR